MTNAEPILDRAADRPTERARLGDRRAAAQDRYGEARCAHQALGDAARRAGVLPGVLRRYEPPREAVRPPPGSRAVTRAIPGARVAPGPTQMRLRSSLIHQAEFACTSNAPSQ